MLLCSLFTLLIITSLSHLHHNRLFFEPYAFAWFIASTNFFAAVFSFLSAQRRDIVSSMAFLFGGMAVRVTVMLSSVISVQLLKKEWLFPYSLTLLGCFVFYLILEVIIVMNSKTMVEIKR